jgi:peptidyl-prolyl cis-trans isomerase SurA
LRTSRRVLGRHLVAVVVVYLLAIGASASAQTFTQRIAAIVNDDVITSGDLIDRINLGIATSGLPNDDATRQRLAPQVLRGFIDEKLQVQEAKRLGIDVTEAEIDQALNTIAQRNRTTAPELVRVLADRGLNPRALREQLRAQIAWIKIVGREVRPHIVITQEQIDLALRRGTTGNDGREVLLSEILLPVYDRSQEEAVLADARSLTAALRGGTAFAALARQVSAAASAENGGDLGWVPLGAITPDLRDRITALPVGQVSDPIVSPAGVHIFQVREQRSTAGAPTDREAVRQSIEQQQLERQASRYLRDLRREAFIDVRI